MSRLSVIDTTVQKTYEWLRDVRQGLESEDEHAAYAALRGTLHALRDRLQTDAVAQLGAQLPLLIRGIYYEGWDPAPSSSRPRAGDFLDGIRAEMHDRPERLDPLRIAQVVLGVLASHVSPGEVEKIVASLPRDIRRIWLTGAFPAPREPS